MIYVELVLINGPLSFRKPLEVVVRHYNVNYTPDDASNHRDGWFLLSIRVNVVKGVIYLCLCV